jgi:Ca2+-binding EF-hand superfamily protein
MQKDFQRIVQGELEALSNFLPKEVARNTINDMFNYMPEESKTSDSGYGNISLANLQYVIKQCFFSEWHTQLEEIYRICIGLTESKGEEQKEKEVSDENLTEED